MAEHELEVEFTPPGPGEWTLDRSHFTGGTTPIMADVISRAMADGFREQFARLGVPAETMTMEFVHGFSYTRLRPLIAPDKPPRKPPPTPVLKVASRLHPEFRRRAAAAARTLATSPAPPIIEEWHTRTRPRLVAQNLAFQALDLDALDERTLAGHIDALLQHLRQGMEEHFRLHAYDLGPIARLLDAGGGWGLEPGNLVPALAGASPSTMAPVEAIARIRAGVEAAGARPTTLDEVRAVSDEVAAELDSYLQLRGSVLYSGYDIDSPTLGEHPEIVLATILHQSVDRQFDVAAHDARVASLRDQVPAPERGRFDRLLDEARDAMDMRDDNGPITAEWPGGLLRLAMLCAGHRLATDHRMHEADHIFELEADELLVLVATRQGPSADELARRAAIRAQEKTLTPPQTLGEPEPPPPLDALPQPLADSVRMVQTAIDQLGMDADVETADGGWVLAGTGIGTERLVGRACVATDAEGAFDTLVPGDILVTRTTSPAYNMVLTLVGGLVTAEGGPMSHAAVLSRELNLPAVVGARDALSAIGSGDLIEIDPANGVVRVVEQAGA